MACQDLEHTPMLFHRTALYWYKLYGRLHVFDWLRSETPENSGIHSWKTWKTKKARFPVKICITKHRKCFHQVAEILFLHWWQGSLHFGDLNFVIFTLPAKIMPRSGRLLGRNVGRRSATVWIRWCIGVVDESRMAQLIVINSLLQEIKKMKTHENSFFNNGLTRMQRSWREIFSSLLSLSTHTPHPYCWLSP